MRDFKNIEYLRFGNLTQQKAYQTLSELKVFEKLKSFNPILTGTIPIEIDIPESDLDIICECGNHDQFSKVITKLFGNESGFTISMQNYDEVKAAVCRFKSNGFKIEIFGQNIPVEKQNAYRHMLIEYQILKEKGTEFRLRVKELKRKGMKTEPAFAKLLQIDGDPYQSLLNYKLSNSR